ncbi:hypothetical protein ROZALSC1DRAFT_26053, partial [Rozella allomycis CSF55]
YSTGLSPNALGGIEAPTSNLLASFTGNSLQIYGYSGTYTIRTSNTGCIDISGFNYIQLQVYLPLASASFNIQLSSGNLGCTGIGSSAMIVSSSYASSSLSNQYQTVYFPLSDFSMSGVDLKKIYMITLLSFTPSYYQFMFINLQFYSTGACVTSNSQSTSKRSTISTTTSAYYQNLIFSSSAISSSLSGKSTQYSTLSSTHSSGQTFIETSIRSSYASSISTSIYQY